MKNGIKEITKHYYTGNHLSSTQLVTDGTGEAVQQVEYAPFGEVVNEYNIDWSNGQVPDFKFNGKELDEENGMYYFEARYQSPPVFISRDPLFDEKHFMSPYSYCSNSPVNRVDPSGMFDDGYTVNKDGYFAKVDNTGGKEYDVIFKKEDYDAGKRDYDETGHKNGIKVEKTFIKSHRHINGTNAATNEPLQLDYYKVKNDEKSDAIFRFLRNNTNVEWSQTGVGSEQDEISYLSTIHQHTSEGGGGFLLANGYTFRFYNHSHPNNPTPSEADMKFAKVIHEKFPKIIPLIYYKNIPYPFNENGLLEATSVKEVIIKP
jgi:RHS repeat-associated protein